MMVPIVMTKNMRSEIMRAVGRENTAPELAVRRLAHRLGLRFRLHRKDLPGTPDLVFPRRRTCLFVHGCFWHRHPDCPKATTPKTNLQYWLPKFRRNVERDREKEEALRKMGWRVLTVWECETKDLNELERRLREAFDLPRDPGSSAR